LLTRPHAFRLFLGLWLAVEAAAQLSRITTQGWPKAARVYADWALYQSEVEPLPLDLEMTFVAMALLLAGLLALWFFRRAGLYLFCIGLLLKLYATFPYVPTILSGTTATLDALSYLLAGFIVACGFVGGVLARKQANPAIDSDTYSAPLRAPDSARHRER
jgi:hypothetical protein